MKRMLSLLMALVMILGVLPMATLAEETTTKPVVHLTADKESVLAGEEVTLTLALDGDINSNDVAGWEWDIIYDSAYFEFSGSQVGTAAQSMVPGNTAFDVTPIVNPSPKSKEVVDTYVYASVTSGNKIIPHYLKAGTIATLTLKAKEDIEADISSKFYFVPIIVMNSSGTALDVVDADAATNWGKTDFVAKKKPADTVGLAVTVKKPLEPINITVYYSDNGQIVTGKDGTLLNYAPVTVTDVNGDGKFTMYDGFACFHNKYHVNGAAGYEDNNWITKFWSVNTAMVSYGHNNGWVFSTAEEIAEGDSLCLFTYQDQTSWSDLFTYFDSLTATATANEETTFHVNGYSFFGSGEIGGELVHATAAPVGATVTATCGDKTLTATTDDKGEFKLTFPAAGEWTVRVGGTCSYTCAVGYYAGQTYTNAPVAPAQMTVTVAENPNPPAQTPDPVQVSMYYATSNSGIVTGKDGTVLNYVSVTVSDGNKDGKLTIDDAFVALHETYYADGAEGYSRNGNSYTFWGAELANAWIALNDATTGITGETEIKAGDKICAMGGYANTAGHVIFSNGVTGTATAGVETTFAINVYTRMGAPVKVNQATATASCGETTVTGTVKENVLTITFPSAGIYTLEIKGVGVVNNRQATPMVPALMTVTVAENTTPPVNPEEPSVEPGYTVTMPVDKTAVVGEVVEIKPTVGYTDETVTTYNAFDMSLTYDTAALELTSTEIEGLTVIDRDGNVRVQGYGADKNVGTAPFTLTFKTLKTGSTDVTLTSAKVDISGNAIESDAPEASITDDVTTITVGGYSVKLPDNFTGAATAEPDKDYTFSEPEDYYDYDVTVKVDGTEVEATDNGDGSYTIPADKVTGPIEVTAEKTGKTFKVTLGTDMSGEKTAQYMTPYTATLTERDGFTYQVSVSIGGKAFTGYTISGGTYTIPGEAITGDIVFNVTRTGQTGRTFSVTFEGNGAGDATGNAYVTPGASYSFTLKKADGYDYEVTATMGGETASYSEEEGAYTFDQVTGNLVITIAKTLHLEVAVSQYVELDGKTVALVTATATLGQGQALSYDGTAMFWSESYNAWSYLVIVEGDALPTSAEAAAKIVATETTYTNIAKTQDVNESGVVDINDAQLVYDIYNGKYQDFTTVSMQKFLKADVSGDRIVNVNDAASVVVGIS